MEHRPWRQLSTRPIYKNPWMDIREDVVEMPNGQTTLYGVCTLGECVGIVPMVDAQHVLMVRQWRYVSQDTRWEIPTGGMHAGESQIEAAQRELQEEVGYQAGQLIHLNSHYTSKSVIRETAHIYLATDLRSAELPPDDTEFIERGAFTLREALDMVLSGEIMDAMSVIGLLLAARGTVGGRW